MNSLIFNLLKGILVIWQILWSCTYILWRCISKKRSYPQTLLWFCDSPILDTYIVYAMNEMAMTRASNTSN